MSTSQPAERSLFLQKEAAIRLVTAMNEEGFGDDAEFIADSIEGQTGLLEAIAKALEEIDECEVIVAGLKAKIQAFDARKKATEDRADRLRGLIEMAMMQTDQHSLKLTTATLSLRKIAPAVEVVTEADIPARFWIEQEPPAPKLDKKALKEALEAKEAVPGAQLTNGSVSLSIRRR